MADLKFPQHDLPVRLSGGSDTWDNDLAGAILTDEYFPDAIKSGSLSVTLPGLSVSATATLSSAPSALTGTLAATLPTLAISAAAGLRINGVLGATLPSLNGSGSGLLAIAGQQSGLLPAFGLSATGSLTNRGTISVLIPGLVGASSGALQIRGQLASTLPPLFGSGSASLAVAGHQIGALPGVVVNAAGSLAIRANVNAELPGPSVLSFGEQQATPQTDNFYSGGFGGIAPLSRVEYESRLRSAEQTIDPANSESSPSATIAVVASPFSIGARIDPRALELARVATQQASEAVVLRIAQDRQNQEDEQLIAVMLMELL